MSLRIVLGLWCGSEQADLMGFQHFEAWPDLLAWLVQDAEILGRGVRIVLGQDVRRRFDVVGKSNGLLHHARNVAEFHHEEQSDRPDCNFA